MNCKNCGTPLELGSKFCPKCGAVQDVIDNNQNVMVQPVVTPVAPVQSAPVPVAPVASAPVQPIQNNFEQKSKSKLPLFIIIGVVLVIFAVAGGIVFVKLNNKDNKEETKTELKKDADEKEEKKDEEKKDEEKKEIDDDEEKYTYNLFDVSKIKNELAGREELSKNIEILGYYRNELKEPGKYEKISVYGKNNNNEPVNLKLTFCYFDKSGVKINETNSNGNNLVKPNSEFVLDIDMQDDSDPYENITLRIAAEKKKTYQEDIPVKPEDIVVQTVTSGNIDVSIKNSSDKEITYGNAGYVLYKDGKIIFAESAHFDTPIPPGGVSKGTLFINLLTNGEFGDKKKQIEFDEARFILFSGYYSNDKNY